ncbi:hypothetical protein AB2N08_16635 [Massilia aurea]|uniref:hypothetical protein n=1 Tax=Massilia aurea TaxID=373040 RepID=UPI003462CC55
MKNPHVTFLIAVAMAWTAPVMAQQPAPDAKTAYQYAMDTAEAGYEATKIRCDALAGVPHEICVADARAARVRVEEEATAAHKNTLAAYTQARMRIATAFHERDKTRCSALVGNDRDVCLAQAKATLVAIQADARADRKAIEARLDANDAKIEAEYRVSMQKCDAFAGAVKDGCVSTARTAYGK